MFTGEYTFRFEPSKVNPGSKTFIQAERTFRVMALLMNPMFNWHTKTQAGFEGFKEILKARVFVIRL